MHRRPVAFFSERCRLDGELYLPDGDAAEGPVPAVVACSGYLGLKDIHPARFARALTPRGYACLAFDYRGFGRSEGERNRIVPQEQVEDVRAACNFLETVPEVDTTRLGLVGWALGGGVAVAAAADDPRPRAVATVNAVGDGERLLRAMHGDDGYARLHAEIAADRRFRVAYGRSRIVDAFRVIRLDELTRGYVDTELFASPGFGGGVTLESAEQLSRFRPDDLVARLAPRPLLLIHGRDNGLHPVGESRELYSRARAPRRLVELADAGHTEWMFDTHPTFHRVADELAAFLAATLHREPVGATA